jgi:hypothetical protein
MLDQDAGFDFPRYRQLLAEAVDEKKRLAFIALLIEERAKDRLEARRAADQVTMTATTIAQMLGSSRPDIAGPLDSADPPAPAIARGVVSG